MVQECNLNKVYTINAHTDKIWSIGNNLPFPQPFPHDSPQPQPNFPLLPKI